MASQLESRGREVSRLVADLSGSVLDAHPALRELREMTPEHVSDEDMVREWERCNKDKTVMLAKIEAWWNDLPEHRAVQGQSTAWEQVTHKKKGQDELSDKFNDMSMRDRKNRGRSAPPTRGGRGGGRGGRASSVGAGRGGRGAPRGPRHEASSTAPARAEPAAAPAEKVAAAAPTETEADPTTDAQQPQQQPQQEQQAQPQVAAPAPAPVTAPTYSAWNKQVSFADVVKNKTAAQQPQAQPQPQVEAPAVEQVPPHANGDVAHEVADGAHANAKQGSARGRGGRGKSGRGEGKAYRQKDTPVAEAETATEQLPVQQEQVEAAPVVEQPVEIPVETAQPVYHTEQETDEQKGYLNMGKWESAIGGASPEVGSFQFGSFGGGAEFDAGAAGAWGASDQLGANSWEVDGDGHTLDHGMSEQGSNAAVNSLFDSSAQESQLHQNERRTAQPPGFDNADTNPPPGLDGLHAPKHDPPGSKRGHHGGRHYQNQRGPAQHQQQGMHQQPMAYGHPGYGLTMPMGEAPGGYMPYMGFGGAVSAPTSTSAPTAASTSSSTATGSSPSAAATGMAHMQQPYGAPQPGMMPGSTAGFSPYYYYPHHMYYQQPSGPYFNRGSYQGPRGPYMSYDQAASGPMYGQYEGMYGMHGVPHSGPAPSGKGSSGSKGGSAAAAAPHHAAAAPAPDMGLNPTASYPFYGGRETQPWYANQQSWGHGGAAPYPQSPQTGGSGSGTGFSQSRK